MSQSTQLWYSFKVLRKIISECMHTHLNSWPLDAKLDGKSPTSLYLNVVLQLTCSGMLTSMLPPQFRQVAIVVQHLCYKAGWNGMTSAVT